MGTLKECIPGYYPMAQTIWDRVAKWEDTFGNDLHARGKAERAAISETLHANRKKRQQVALSAAAWDEVRSVIEAGGDRPGQAFTSLLVRDYTGVNADRMNIESLHHSLRTQARVKAAPLMDLAAATAVKDAPAVSAEFLRAGAGKPVGNPMVARAAHHWTATAEWLLSEFNRLGGDIRKLNDWLLPMRWEADKIFPRGTPEAEARDAFVGALAELYETPGRMAPIMGTDAAPATGAELRLILADIADGIRTGNTHGTVGHVGAPLKDKHRDPRVIRFLDVEDRIEFARRFGNENAFEVMDQHIEVLTREIATMRVLGPNPDHTFAQAFQAIAEKGYGGRGFSSDKKLAAMEATYLSVTGALTRPAVVSRAHTWAAGRSFLSAGLLPLSIASQLSDVVPVSLTAAFNGLPVVRTLAEGIKALRPLSREDRAFLVRLGVDLDGMTAQLTQAGVQETASRSRWLAEKTLQWNGTRKWTEAWYSTLQRQYLGRLADLRGRTLAEADAALNRALTRYGWTPGEWDLLRQYGVFEDQGATWVSAHMLEQSELAGPVRDGLIARLIHTVQTEGRIAMTMPDARVRAAMAGGQQAGTVLGELARTGTQFKSFSTQLMLNQIGRMMQIESTASRVAYGTALLAGFTMMGAMSVQVKRLLKGQEPADTAEPAFWTSALLQGGGLGILGDFAAAGLTGENRFGQGFISTIAGPGAGALEDAIKLTAGNVGQAARGEQTNFQSEAIRTAGRYVPLINLPFYGVATQRLVIDQLRLMADPSGTRRSFMSSEQRQRQEFNSRYWWRPGQTLPEFLR